MLLLSNAKPLLLVDNKQTQVFEENVFLEQAVRAYTNVHRAGGELFEDRFLLKVTPETAENLDLDRERLQPLGEGGIVLLRQDRRRTSTATCLPSWTALKAARRATSVLP